MLHHERQKLLYGCMYHAAYAVTSDQTLLDEVEDVSPLRFSATLAAKGWIVIPYFGDVLCDHWTDLDWWMRLCEKARDQNAELKVTISIRGTKPGWLHDVAVEIGEKITVSDSMKDGLLTFYDWSEFGDSPYARACRVSSIIPADTNIYPRDPGALHFDTSGDYDM